MTDFLLTAELRAILQRPEVRVWMLENVRQGAAPAWGEDVRLCLRFVDDDEGESFRRRWLQTQE